MSGYQQKIKQFLAFLAKKILQKYQPVIVGVTGSIGKTSARHAIALALSTKYTVREPQRNYNNEIGIPLTIIGAKGVDESYFNILGFKLAWLRVFFEGLCVWLLPLHYPKVLVLEYGIDHPGDMDRLLAIARPSVVVVTTIGVSHKANFQSQSDIVTEKMKLPKSLSTDGLFLVNQDDSTIVAESHGVIARKVSFGQANADVQLVSASELLAVKAETTIKIQTPNESILTVKVPAVGTAHTEAVLVGVAVATAMGVEPVEITKGLMGYRGIPGRSNVLAGVKHSILIDDTYNAAPLSVQEALALFQRFPNNGPKIIVLGDMLELGEDAVSSHQQIGEVVATLNPDALVTVGPLGKIIAETAGRHGLVSTRVHSFDSSEVAGGWLIQNLQPNSLVLIKGSQGVRMEKITKELLAEPMSATHVLARQYGHWLDK